MATKGMYTLTRRRGAVCVCVESPVHSELKIAHKLVVKF